MINVLIGLIIIIIGIFLVYQSFKVDIRNRTKIVLVLLFLTGFLNIFADLML